MHQIIPRNRICTKNIYLFIGIGIIIYYIYNYFNSIERFETVSAITPTITQKSGGLRKHICSRAEPWNFCWPNRVSAVPGQSHGTKVSL